MTDDIKLPPLPPLWIVPSVEPVDYPEVAQALMDYARAAVEADRIKQEDYINDDRDQLRAEIVALKGTIADLEADRLRRGEPVAQQPVEGEEIMVNAAHDVYTLPLQPSGLSSGPRFVVHVPGPEAQGGGKAAPPSAPVGAAEDMVLDAIERRESSAPVGAGGKMAEVVRFLMGEAPLEGRWFDEPGGPHVGGAYWWRKHLTDALAQQPAARPPKPTECMNGCPDRQVCDHCQWPPGPDQQTAAVDGSDAQAAEIEALRAEVAEWKRVAAARGEAEARAERLAEALRHSRWCRTCAEDGWESCEDSSKNDALLREQEKGRG